MTDYKEIETKWQKAWADAKIFESEPNDSKKAYMVSAAFPYTNASLHIGHFRTYGTADALARYKRMQGYNVLFPMAFHATGTPILAFAKRIAANDKELIEEMHRFHVKDEDIKQMADPEFIANYFIKTISEDLKLAGYSIDWRRKFISIEPLFSKFVEWQFGILNNKGYLTQGKHPVGWCPNENNAVGMHDTKHDVEPEIEEQTAVRFMVDGEDAGMLCATYRPETIFGATNLFVAEKAKYVVCKLEGSRYYISKAAAEILSNQFQIEVEKEVSANELLAKRVVNPINGAKIPVLPGFFVKEEVGTGVVMSVPAHAPFDYAALERLKGDGKLKEEINPIKVLDVKIGRSLSDVSVGESKPSQLDVPALAYLEILHTDPKAIDDMLEFATKLEYREESHWGKMIVKGYEGMSEPDARDAVKKKLVDGKNAIGIYVLQNAPVQCRCGYNVVVKIVDNQWFINYGNGEWKKQVWDWFKHMKIMPDQAINGFKATFDWIDMRAVARAQGLGTRFPFDKKFIIESLSDSTIYPAFYTICHIIRGVEVEKLKPEFFDYVFLGKGKLEKVAESTQIQYETVKRARESFLYWYVYTSRHSYSELIPNHLTMYIFNHIAVFGKEHWPKQIVANGGVLSEGEKMSKSLGNIIPLVDAIGKHGVDPLRIIELAGADLYSDSEYNEDAIRGVKERFDNIYNSVLNLDKLNSGELKRIDYWLYSVLSRKTEKATQAMEKMELRNAYTKILYDSVLELKRYSARGGNNNIAVKDFLTNVALMLQPVAPHISEEIWHMLGNQTFASTEKWPIVDPTMQNQKIEDGEALVDSTSEDMKQVIVLMQKKTGKKAREAKIIVADDWKRTLVNIIAKQRDVNKTMEEAKKDKTINMESAAKIIASLTKKMNEVKDVNTTQQEEFEAFDEAKEYISKLLNCSVTVEMESTSKSERAGRAMPNKPSLDIKFE